MRGHGITREGESLDLAARVWNVKKAIFNLKRKPYINAGLHKVWAGFG